MDRIVPNKDYIRNYLYTNKPPETVSQVLNEIEAGLKEIYDDSIIGIITLGSLNGNWSIRKARGLDKENNDIDWGIYVNADQKFLDDNGFNTLEDFLRKITEFVVFALEEFGLESCETFNATNCFFNKNDLPKLVAKAKRLVDSYNEIPEDSYLEMQELAMIYQSKDKDIITQFENYLQLSYPDYYLKIIGVIKTYVDEMSKVKPHHFFRNQDEYRNQPESVQNKFDRAARRLQGLREAAAQSEVD